MHVGLSAPHDGAQTENANFAVPGNAHERRRGLRFGPNARWPRKRHQNRLMENLSSSAPFQKGSGLMSIQWMWVSATSIRSSRHPGTRVSTCGERAASWRRACRGGEHVAAHVPRQTWCRGGERVAQARRGGEFAERAASRGDCVASRGEGGQDRRRPRHARRRRGIRPKIEGGRGTRSGPKIEASWHGAAPCSVPLSPPRLR